MADLRNARVIITKGLLFLALGVIASTLLVLKTVRLDVALLHGLAVWAFCRFYYFAFYVIQHYVDPGFRFAGLMDFCCYLFGRTKRVGQHSDESASRRLEEASPNENADPE